MNDGTIQQGFKMFERLNADNTLDLKSFIFGFTEGYLLSIKDTTQLIEDLKDATPEPSKQ
jgi:hypothetical protein